MIGEQCSSQCSHVTCGSATVATIITFTSVVFPMATMSNFWHRYPIWGLGRALCGLERTALQKPFLQKRQQTLEKKG